MAKVTQAIRWILSTLIKGYQYFISPLFGPSCRFYPTCSQYNLDAIQQHGACKGGLMGVKRLLKCHPWHAGGFDPVPQPKKERL